MATATLASLNQGLSALPVRNRIGLMIGIAAVGAIAFAAWLWSSAPDYRVLYAGLADKDGGAIVQQLSQMNVPYKFTDGGGAILVPADKVHDLRLKLASQGLPHGTVTGFELMDNQKLGTTQFQEQMNWQRGLEGELARSIQTLASVAAARVHLAIPRQSVFVREQDKPTASVLVTLHAGRTLDRAQVAGIVHLVASSVPELAPRNVSVVDQTGNLLSQAEDGSAAVAHGALNATQLQYVRDLEQATIARIEEILSPLVGRENVRAQVTAEVDFTQTEQTAETFKPNGTPGDAAIRSTHSSESTATQGQAGGVPGAASNQPGASTQAATATPNANANARKESAVNYEVDRTVRTTVASPGTVKRLTAAVVVNHRTKVVDGKTERIALTQEEMTQVNALVRQAMGFLESRGDSLNVVNAPFNLVEAVAVPEAPVWKQPETIAIAKDGAKYFLIGAFALAIVFGVLRPLLKQLAQPGLRTVAAGGAPALAGGDAPAALGAPRASNEALGELKQRARQDPKLVANVVKTWVSGHE